ncbi:hypothetical protein F5Y15DRAFT_354893 [Xylariaceae sp. FL0016]|nr:hypothetical protein F5Y15DRAFT_354893 [Xylariaceae sp. FL0016]
MNILPETNAGVVTSWIPITTAHPTQAGCDQHLWKFIPNTIAAWDPGYGMSVDPDATCHPKPVTTWWLQDRLGINDATVLSLGPLTCPQAYYTATASAKDSSSTFVACCPIDYDFISFFDPGNTGECTSRLNKDDVVTYAERDDSGQWGVSTSTVTADTTVAAIPVNGWKIAAETTASGYTNDCQASALETAASTSDSCSSNCEAIGIGVGVSLGVTGLACLAAGIWIMYRARKGAKSSSSVEKLSSQYRPSCPGSPPAATDHTPMYATYHPESRGTTSLTDGLEYSQYDSQASQGWGISTAPHSYQPASSTASHPYARTIPHGEMEGSAVGGVGPHSSELEAKVIRGNGIPLAARPSAPPSQYQHG